MRLAQRKIALIALALTLIFSASVIQAQRSSGTLRGRVVDELGALITGARVAIKNGNGVEKTAVTDANGSFQISALVPGKYVVQASAPGFALYEKRDTDISAQTSTVITIALTVAPLQQEVTTNTSLALNTDPESNAGAIILKSKELDALPDDPDELANALQALAGPSAGPSGGQIFIDGFTSTRLPSKESIREVRINQNPFSAEFDRIGLGRIDILTKPGADKFHGQGSFNFGDESLNSRNPFAPTRVPFQERNYTGSVSGPIKVKKSSFFIDFGRRETDTNVIINASILDSALNIIRFNSGVLTPQRRTNFSSRFDYQVNRKNTVTGRYTVTHATFKNSGLSDQTLPSVAYPSSNTEQALQLTETAVLGPKVINETRFQYLLRHSKTEGDNSLPTTIVLDAFTDGGAQIGKSSYTDHRWELQNYTLFASGNHTLRIGERLRGVHVTDSSPSNFGGTFTFGSGNGPQLSSNNTVVLDGNAQPLFIRLSSIERYRRTLLFQQQGLSASEIRALGGGATQFSIATGSPLAKVNQIDFGPFIQDDWRLRPNFTLSLGLRYETQTNIHDRTDFAPRVSFAWGLRGNKTQSPAMVIRGGFGIFYDRFPENLTLYATRFNGINQQRFLINNPDFFPTVPSGEFLASLQVPQTITRVAQDLKTPYTMQSAISLERQLPLRLILSATFINTRTVHGLRSRNVNAPLPGTFGPSAPGSGTRPLADAGNILEYESNAWFNQNQLLINIKNQVNSRFSFFATYSLSKANADSDGVDSFPANSYDLHSEYGRSGLDTRHRFVFVGVVDLLRGFSLNPFIVMRSGLPFNIITGRDANGDALFAERPALATEPFKPGVAVTPFGPLDPDSEVAQRIIPRNFGEGPGFIAVNIRISKIFGFGSISEKSGAQSSATQKPKKPTSGDGQRTLNIYGNEPIKQPYQLTVSVQVRNLLNRSNFGLPIGNLGSLFFGRPNSLAPSSGFGISGDPIVANRRIEAQIRFTF